MGTTVRRMNEASSLNRTGVRTGGTNGEPPVALPVAVIRGNEREIVALDDKGPSESANPLEVSGLALSGLPVNEKGSLTTRVSEPSQSGRPDTVRTFSGRRPMLGRRFTATDPEWKFYTSMMLCL
jgi:hypothetical protein